MVSTWVLYFTHHTTVDLSPDVSGLDQVRQLFHHNITLKKVATVIGFGTRKKKSKCTMLHYRHFRFKNGRKGLQYANILPKVLKVIVRIFDTMSINIRLKKYMLCKLCEALGVTPMSVPL